MKSFDKTPLSDVPKKEGLYAISPSMTRRFGILPIEIIRIEGTG